MHPIRIYGLVLRYISLYKRSLPRLFEIVFWPVMDLLVWGFLTVHLQRTGQNAGVTGSLLGAMIFWDILYRSQQSVTMPFLEDLWGRSILNIFIAPVGVAEILSAAFTVGFLKILLTAGLTALLAAWFYQFDLLQVGLFLIPFFFSLLVTGWSIGMVTTALIIRWGQAAEALAWGIPFLLQPFSAVFYPVSVLPGWLQPLALALPPTHVFEGLRQILADPSGPLPWGSLAWSAGLNLVFLGLSGSFFVFMLNRARDKGLLAKLGTQ